MMLALTTAAILAGVRARGHGDGPIETHLNLLPAAPLARQLYKNDTLTTWGGSVVRGDDGDYHLYAAAFGLGCSLCSWHSNSFVMHGVASVLAGPYRWSDVALPMEH